jgi:hypothetical protein
MDAEDRGQNGNALNTTDRDTLFLLGGVALVVFGAGLILSNPTARRMLGQVGLGDLTAAALPDVERYMKLRSM